MTYFLSQVEKKISNIARGQITRAMLCVRKAVEPKSTTEDHRRKERILNIILLISISSLIILGLTIAWNITHNDEYSGINPLIFIIVVSVYGSLFYISKKGFWKISSILLIILNASGTIYTGWQWGASLPETLLLTVLTIETAGVLIGSTFGFVTAGVMISGLTLLGIHEAVYLDVPDWRYDEISITDVITYSTMFLFVSFIAWISNKDIDLSLMRARRSETLLEIERNNLEQRVSERTKELILNQQKNIVEVEHTIRIGELARGVIHDMMNPLSSIALYIEDINRNPEKYNRKEAKILFEKTLNISRKMTDFMESTRCFISNTYHNKKYYTNLKKEINIACDVVAYKARRANVHIENKNFTAIRLLAHPTRIHQILINILSNAIDSYANTKQTDKNRMVLIETESCDGIARIIISDNGCGMDISNMEKLFTQSKTTKPKGLGIGLSNVYSIVKHELNGSIEVTSTKELGTKFIINLPILLNEKSNKVNQK